MIYLSLYAGSLWYLTCFERYCLCVNYYPILNITVIFNNYRASRLIYPDNGSRPNKNTLTYTYLTDYYCRRINISTFIYLWIIALRISHLKRFYPLLLSAKRTILFSSSSFFASNHFLSNSGFCTTWAMAAKIFRCRTLSPAEPTRTNAVCTTSS